MDGKISKSEFENIFIGHLGHSRQEVTTGPAFGVDVSIIDIGPDQQMALTSDPLSLIPSLGLQESAWLSVHLMANDMATTGQAPQYGQFVLNLPPSLSEEDFKTYWSYVDKFCKDLKLSITGGHTGTIAGQNSTIAGGGTFITVGKKGSLLTSQNAQVGDVILMTKHCAISSAAILGMSFPKTVEKKAGKEVVEKANELFYSTSSLQEALVAAQFNQDQVIVSAMHDVTEGGVLGAVYEFATASGKGVNIKKELLPVYPAVKSIFDIFELDPHYCIGAGSMLITVKKGKEDEIIEALKSENIACTAIGEISEAKNGINTIDEDGKATPIRYPEKDPYWAAFFKALEKGWN